MFASDLDNTLIYSYKKVKGDALCVEEKDGKDLSFITPQAHLSLCRLVPKVHFVPVTTRSMEQYLRIYLHLPRTDLPQAAVTGNGTSLLLDGQEDKAWRQETQRLIEDCLLELQHALVLLSDDTQITLLPRMVDGAFVFAKTSNMPATVARLLQRLNLSRVTVDCVGNEKVYVLPKPLTKGLAIQRLRKRFASEQVIAAGDSSFDVSMLQEADFAIFPGELHMLEALKNKQEAAVGPFEGMSFAQFVLDTVAERVEIW